MAASCVAVANAQGPHDKNLQAVDPFQFFDQFLGKETATDREAVKGVKISRREETQAGAAALQSFLTLLKQRGTKVRKDGADVRYIQRLVARIQPLMENVRRYPAIQIRVVETEDTDARSFPGGTIVISKGLIEFCESEAALVGVLGHELSHIDRGHQLNALKRWKLAEQSFTKPSPAAMMSAGGMMARLFTQPFRPDEETEADEDGARWAWQLGYEPMELAKVFHRLHQRDADQPNFKPSFLQSHPFHKDRYQAIAKQSDALKRQRPKAKYHIGTGNLRRRTAWNGKH